MTGIVDDGAGRSSFNAFGDEPIPVAPCKCGYQWRTGALPEEICSHGGGEYVVVCFRCKATGELKATPKWAVEAWNAEHMPIETNNVVERLPDKIKSRVKVCDDGCWRWQGWIDPQGYGYCYYEGKRHSTHRLSYQVLVGPIPSDLVCDHLCCVRNCLNPAHIELVTSGINVLRGHERRKIAGRPALNLRNHCRKGHEFTPENTFMHWRGRTCRTCQYASQQRYRRKIKAQGRRDKIAELERQVTVLSDRIDVLEGERERFLEVEKAARELPRATPGPGGCSTEHQFAIEAGVVWTNDLALKRLDKFRASLTQGGKTNG